MAPYTTEQLKDLEALVNKVTEDGTYDFDDLSQGDIHTPLNTVSHMIYMSGHQCQFFQENFKKEVDHYRSIYSIGDGRCHWADIYDILFVFEIRDLPTRIHHFLKPLVNWRLKNGI